MTTDTKALMIQLQKEVDEINKLVTPLRAEKEKLLAQIAPLKEKLKLVNTKIVELQGPLAGLECALAPLARHHRRVEGRKDYTLKAESGKIESKTPKE